MLVVLEPAVEEEAVVGSGAAAASASLRLSFILPILGGQAEAGRRRKRRKRERWDMSGLVFLWCRDRCMSALSRCQMTELTQTVWAAAGSAWVNISWGPEWIGQHSEFRTKPLTHCLNSRLTSQSRDKMIIYYSHTTQAVNLSHATGLIEILCVYKSTESTVHWTMFQCREDYKSTILSHHGLCTQQVYLLYIQVFVRGKKDTMYCLC